MSKSCWRFGTGVAITVGLWLLLRDFGWEAFVIGFLVSLAGYAKAAIEFGDR